MNTNFDLNDFEAQASEAFDKLIEKVDRTYPAFFESDDGRLYVSLDPVTQFSLTKSECERLIEACSSFLAK